ncbi:alpha/beta hydrolase [Gracilibacillus caseinilyticus]|uniref:Alpha/beta hydrolase n=1 Tax=Gracilibacillus caseinilyticus TaxID=2932256 RepID=A0ABY4EQZ9_9BACI|nr:alpha/beta hydrolase [Gracilibacillus caseinilyticus]UOQ46853.1 alpha/beta hydrolase [Gracilibacillus caseinilyticus]
MIYEAPSFDIGLSAKSLMKKAVCLLERDERKDVAMLYSKYVNDSYPSKAIWKALALIYNEFSGNRKDYIYLKSMEPQELNRIYDSVNVPDEFWERTTVHIRNLEEEGLIFESLLPIIPSVTQASLVLHGQFDPVFCDQQRNIFIEYASKAKMIVFEESAHFPRLEEPEKYTKEVINFILKN